MKTPTLFLLPILLCSASLLAQTTAHLTTQAVDQNKNQHQIVSNFILPTADTAVEAHFIKVGEYVAFLNDVAFDKDVHELYCDAMGSQIVWASEEDGYVIAAGVGSDDLMLNLTSFDVNDYFNWVANSSPQKSDSCSPLMMFGEDEKMPGADKPDPRTTSDARSDAGAGSGGQAARGDASNLSLTEAATQTADHARENLTVEQLPGGTARDSRISIATEASAIADMLVSYVGARRSLFSNHPEAAQNIAESALQKAATWEAAVSQSVQIAKMTLATAVANHASMEKIINSHVGKLNSAIRASKEVHTMSVSSRSNLEEAAINAAGAIPAAVVGHFGPLIIEGAKLTVETIRSGYSAWEAGKKDKAVVTFMNDFNYAVAKEAVLESIKNRAAKLNDALAAIQQEAERSLAIAMEASPEKSNELSLIKQSAQESAQTLRISHAEDLLAWANDKAQATAQAATRDQVAMLAAQSDQTHAGNILDGIKFHADFLTRKKIANEELSRAKTEQTALGSLLNTAEATLEENQKSLDAKYPKSSITGTRALSYKESKEYKQKHAAKTRVEELNNGLEQANVALAEKEISAQAATVALAEVENRLNIWNNLKAWHTVVTAHGLKELSRNTHASSPLTPKTSQHHEQADQKMPQQKTEQPLQPSGAAEDEEESRANSDIATMKDSMVFDLKTTQLGNLAADLTQENQKRATALKAGKPIDITRTTTSSAAASDLGTDLDNRTRNRLVVEHSGYAAQQTGASADAAINRFVAVKTGEPEDPVEPAVISLSENPMSVAVTEELITEARFDVFQQTGKAAQDAVAAFMKQQAESKKNRAAKLAFLKK